MSNIIRIFAKQFIFMDIEEKTKELVDKFREQFYGYGLTEEERTSEAVVCAYLCTEEVIMALYDKGVKEPQEWYDVQKKLDEIEKSL